MATFDCKNPWTSKWIKILICNFTQKILFFVLRCKYDQNSIIIPSCLQKINDWYVIYGPLIYDKPPQKSIQWMDSNFGNDKSVFSFNFKSNLLYFIL